MKKHYAIAAIIIVAAALVSRCAFNGPQHGWQKIVSAVFIVGVLAASVSTATFADDHCNYDRGNGVAVVAGILGAVVIGSLIANSQPIYAAPQLQ